MLRELKLINSLERSSWMVLHVDNRPLKLLALFIFIAMCVYRVGHSLSYTSPAHSEEVVDVEICGFNEIQSRGRYQESTNLTHIIRVYEGMICVSKIFLKNSYSEPPHPLLGATYFPGSLVVVLDLLNRKVVEYVIVNLTTYGPSGKLVVKELYAATFTYRKIGVRDIYEGPIIPKVKFLDESGNVNLTFLVLTYEVLSYDSGICTYAYRALNDATLLSTSNYRVALDFWSLVFEELLNLRVKVGIARLDLQLVIPLSCNGDLNEYIELLKLVNETLTSSNEVIVFIEVPHPITYRNESLVAVSIDNFIITSSRDVDVLIHEVGHVLGLVHPRVNNDLRSHANVLFHESIMLASLSNNRKRLSIGDLLGLAHSTSILLKQLNITSYIRFKEYVDVLLMDIEELSIILPLVMRVYVSNEIPKPISDTLKEGFITLEVSSDGFITIHLNYKLIELLKTIRTLVST